MVFKFGMLAVFLASLLRQQTHTSDNCGLGAAYARAGVVRTVRVSRTTARSLSQPGAGRKGKTRPLGSPYIGVWRCESTHCLRKPRSRVRLSDGWAAVSAFRAVRRATRRRTQPTDKTTPSPVPIRHRSNTGSIPDRYRSVVRGHSVRASPFSDRCPIP